jgi:deazaflavin-dependent oxidoreductase (nitroreductase family)
MPDERAQRRKNERDGNAEGIASSHGSDRNPDWYHNLGANPDITIEKGTKTIPVRATEVRGAERDAVFARHKTRFPVFADYERRLERIIPAIRFDRRTPERGATRKRRDTSQKEISDER